MQNSSVNSCTQTFNMERRDDIYPILYVLRITPQCPKYGFDIYVNEEMRAVIVTHLSRKSEAWAGGMRKGDCIIEINGENVENFRQQEIHHRIKSSPSVLRLLVLNHESWNRAKIKNVLGHGNMPSILTVDPLQPHENQAFTQIYPTLGMRHPSSAPETYPMQPYPSQPYPRQPYPLQPGLQPSFQAPYPFPPPGLNDGSDMQQHHHRITQEKPPPPTNYCIPSIFICLFCCCLFGIAGMVMSRNAKKMYEDGDIDGAFKNSSRAKKMCILGLILGILVIAGNVIRAFTSV